MTRNDIGVDKALEGVPRSKIRDQLLEVGFDDSRQAEIVGGLSGGWKMKLELARAMLYNADLLLLDEVCSIAPSFAKLSLTTPFPPKAYQSCTSYTNEYLPMTLTIFFF